MPSPSLRATLLTKLHTIHPGLVLPVIGFGAWLTTTAVLVLLEPKPGPGDRAVVTPDATTGSAETGGTPPAGTNTQAPYSIVGPVPAPAVPASGGLLSGILGGLLGGGGGDSGGGGFGDGNAARPKAPGQTRASLVPKPSTTGTAPAWTSVRKVKEGETTNDIFGFLTTEPNKEVGAIHPKAMPVILTTGDEIDLWMTAPAGDALKLQRPLADGALRIVARGEKEDKGGLTV
jgi:hypothetical protein